MCDIFGEIKITVKKGTHITGGDYRKPVLERNLIDGIVDKIEIIEDEIHLELHSGFYIIIKTKP